MLRLLAEAKRQAVAEGLTPNPFGGGVNLYYPPILENEMEKEIANEMETGVL